MLSRSEEVKKEEEKKRIPLSLEELIAKKKAEDEAESKVRLINVLFLPYTVSAHSWVLLQLLHAQYD